MDVNGIHIYHIVHYDRLHQILQDGALFSDSIVRQACYHGTGIGMQDIKDRRLQLSLSSHPGLKVGECVPFYFCTRSVMLYLLHKGNHPNLTYTGGQAPLIHLEAHLPEVIHWAETHHKRWAFTLSNAGSRYFEDRCNLGQLNEINWVAVNSHSWQQHREEKMAEFLVEETLPVQLFKRIGVYSNETYHQVKQTLNRHQSPLSLEIKKNWYY